jgi:hypothetical protein
LWSIAGHLDHINRTLLYYLARIEETSAANLAPRSASNPLMSEAEEEFLQEVEPPIRAMWNTPDSLLPSAPLDPGQLADDFPLLREKYANAIRLIARRGLAAAPITASLHPPVRTVAAVLAMLAAHDRRHLWQIEQLRNSGGFPAFRGM